MKKCLFTFIFNILKKMVLETELRDIFLKVQKCSSTHQKCRKHLCNLYNKHPNNKFTDIFKDFLRKTICAKNVGEAYLMRLLDFCSSFVVEVTEETNKQNLSQEELLEESTHPFLADIFDLTLEYHDCSIPVIKYRSCILITSLLKYLREGFLDNEICDKIEEAMLQRIVDLKPTIRCQAVIALARLQDPSIPECPVIKSFLLSFGDFNPIVRKHVVEVIAISTQTVPKILVSLNDVDVGVRMATFKRLTIIEPKLMKIEQRQTVIHRGFKETNKRVRDYFESKLLPKWLSCYNGDYLQLLKAVKLDAYETDFEMTEFLNTSLLEVYFKANPLNEIIQHLPIDENKQIPLDKLTSEAAIFWRLLVNYLRRNVEEYTENIIPDLPSFCDYVYSFHKEKESQKLEHWKFYEFQTIVANLLLILRGYDFSDVAGRDKVHNLIERLMIYSKCPPRVLDELMNIYIKLTPNVETFTNEICLILSNIREPLVEEEGLSEQDLREKDYKVAQLTVKIHMLMEDQSQAVKNQDFEKAALIKNQMTTLRQEIDKIETGFNDKMRSMSSTRDETEINCHVLNVVIAMLKLEELNTVTTSIRTLKNELIVPLLQDNDRKIYCKTLESLALCCLLDFEWAEEHLKSIVYPIIHYRVISTPDKNLILTSIKILSDLALLYGTRLFKRASDSEDTCSGDTMVSNASVRKQGNKSRRLHTINDTEDLDLLVNRCLTLNELVEGLLDMLDDDQEDIRYCAAQGLCNLLRAGKINSPSIIARLSLKWFIPVTEKNDIKLQQLVGFSLLRYAETVVGSEEVLGEAVIPILMSIANAPCTSPLADINMDNTINFLSVVVGVKKSNCIVNQHLKLAQSLCHKIQTLPQHPAVPIYTKMLLCLEPSLEDPVIIDELLKQVDHLLEGVQDKGPYRNLKKFKMSLTNIVNPNRSELTISVPSVIQQSTVETVFDSLVNDKNDKEENEQQEVEEEERRNKTMKENGNRKSVRFHLVDSEKPPNSEEEQIQTEECNNSKRKYVNDASADSTEVEVSETEKAAKCKEKSPKCKEKSAKKKAKRNEVVNGNKKQSEKESDRELQLTAKANGTNVGNNTKTKESNEKNGHLNRRKYEEDEKSSCSISTRSSRRISDVSSNTIENVTTRTSGLVTESVKRRKDRKSKKTNDFIENGEETVLHTINYDNSHQLEFVTFSDEESVTASSSIPSQRCKATTFSDEEESFRHPSNSTSNNIRMSTRSSDGNSDARVALTDTSTDNENPMKRRCSRRKKTMTKRFKVV